MNSHIRELIFLNIFTALALLNISEATLDPSSINIFFTGLTIAFLYYQSTVVLKRMENFDILVNFLKVKKNIDVLEELKKENQK